MADTDLDVRYDAEETDHDEEVDQTHHVPQRHDASRLGVPRHTHTHKSFLHLCVLQYFIDCIL